MRRSIIAIAAVVAVLLSGLGLVSAQASAPVAAVAASTRGFCVKVGTGEIRNLWLTAAGKCPVYSPTDAYWGPITFGAGATGPQGPQGPKGDPGDSSLVSQKATVHLTSASVAQTVTVAGLPAFVTGLPEIATNNYAARPLGSNFTIAALPVAAGDIVRKFSIGAPTGLGTNSFDLTIQVISIP